MKLLLQITAILLIANFASVIADECDELKEKELKLKCEQTDFDEYRKCLADRKELRRKRALICPITGQVIDINTLSGSDGIHPTYVVPPSPISYQSGLPSVVNHDVQPNNPPSIILPTLTASINHNELQQPSSHYHQPSNPSSILLPSYVSNTNRIVSDQSHPDITSNTNKYSQSHVSIDSEAAPSIQHNWIIQGKDKDYVHRETYRPARNVTTVIRLTNLINNTNIVNVPTTINATNINNITIFTNNTKNHGFQDFGLGVNDEGSCCFVVQPKTCHTGPQGIRCHHRRHKTCGEQCTSRIIHSRSSRQCKRGRCHSKINYIPQPSPKCVYTNNWPYVNCGYRRRDPCDGCYDHYNMPSAYGYYEPPNSCMGCYDEGFEYGQMYRRGPVLRPHFYHEPPCYITGTCYDGGYDGYGGYSGYRGAGGYGGHSGYGGYDYSEFSNEPEFESTLFEDDASNENGTDNGNPSSESDWGVVMQKCKQVSDDGSYTIINCTKQEDHPYAAAPSFLPSHRPSPFGHYPLHHRAYKVSQLKHKKSGMDLPRPLPTEIIIDDTSTDAEAVKDNIPHDDYDD